MKKYFLLISLLMISMLIVSCGEEDPPPPTTADPEAIVAVNGDLYRGAMNSSLTTPLMTFEVQDGSNNALAGETVLFRTIIGDGVVFSDSVTTDSVGQARCVYTMSGDMGHAIIQAKSPDVDSTTVEVRANTLIPGVSGQAYYVLFDDTYGDVFDWLGAPAAIDADPNFWLNYAVYEDQLGVVVLIDDANHDTQVHADEAVLGVIVNTVYAGTTADGIGIGSLISEVKAVYDTATGVYDPTPPAAYRYSFPAAGLTFYTDTNADEALREVFEIHLNESISTMAPVKRENPGNLIKASRKYRISN